MILTKSVGFYYGNIIRKKADNNNEDMRKAGADAEGESTLLFFIVLI